MTIYHSFAFDPSPQDAVIEGDDRNLSTTGIISKISHKRVEWNDAPTIAKYRAEETLKQVRFVTDMLPQLSSASLGKKGVAALFEKIFGFPPNDLTIYIKSPDNCTSIFKNTDEDIRIKAKLNVLWPTLESPKHDESKSFADSIVYGIFTDLIRFIQRESVHHQLDKVMVLDYLSDVINYIAGNVTGGLSSFDMETLNKVLKYSFEYFSSIIPKPDRFFNRYYEHKSALDEIIAHISKIQEYCSELNASIISKKLVSNRDYVFEVFLQQHIVNDGLIHGLH